MFQFECAENKKDGSASVGFFFSAELNCKGREYLSCSYAFHVPFNMDE